MRIVAIDFGEKRTGIAVTDDNKIIATPLTTVDTKELHNFLLNYSTQNKIEGFVIGLPLRLNNTMNDLFVKIEIFKKQLELNFKNCYIEYYDERFTSKMALDSIVLVDNKKKKRQDKSLIDKVSASILLQDFLYYKKNKK